MKFAPLALGALLAACSSAPIEIVIVKGDAGEGGAAVPEAAAPDTDPGRAADAGDAAQVRSVSVELSWVYFETNFECNTVPIVCSKDGSCPGSTDCVCSICSAPGGTCRRAQAITKCCSANARILESDLARLAVDYPRCKIEQKGPDSYGLTCSSAADADPALYKAMDGDVQGPLILGTPQKHTRDSKCLWDLPYAAK